MMLRRMRNFLFGSLRGRLILGVAAVQTVMMTLFIFDVTGRQRLLLLDRQAEDATALAQSLATSAAGWIKADDIAGLQELVESQRRYPELLFAILADEQGLILAHTEQSKQGLYLQDLPDDIRLDLLNRTPALVDAVAPALLGGRHVGWARVGIGQEKAGKKLAAITLKGIIYAVAAIVIGSLMAWGMGCWISRRLYAVQETINTVRKGDKTARSSLAGGDEAAAIAREFNALLDMLDERDSRLSVSEEKYRALFEGASDAVFIHGILDDGMPGPFREVNEQACRRLGYSREEFARLSPMELDDPAYRNRIPKAMEELFQKGHTVFETAHLSRDGLSIPVEVSSRVVEIRGERLLVSIARDISERKRTAGRLESQHALLHAILNSAKDIIIFSLDRNYCYTTFNQKHRQEMKTVWHADIAIGMNLLECITMPELRERAQRSIDRALQGETFTEVQHQPEPDIYYEFIWNPVELNGTIVGATVFIRDITEGKRAEAALRKSEALYASLIAASPDGVGVTDEQGKVLFASRRIYEMLKVPPEQDLKGSNALVWLIDEDRQRAGHDLFKISQGQVVSDVSYTLVRNDGSTLPVEISGAPIFGEGHHLEGIVTLVRDATPRRQAENELRLSREALHKREAELNEAQRLAHIGSWDWDARHDTIWWSDEYYRIYGFDPNQPTPNYEEHKKAYTAESAERLDRKVKRAMENGEPYEVDLELALPTPGTRWIVARGEAKRDENGKIWGLRGTAQNITERKLVEQASQSAKNELEQRVIERTTELERKSAQLLDSRQALMNLVDDLGAKTGELEDANDRLKELDQLKSMFIASMSHELRTPLNSIIGFSSILADEWLGPLNEEQKKNMLTVLRSGKHLLALINDVIDVSKIEAGKLEISIDDFDLSEVVAEAAALFSKEMHDKGLEFEVESLPLQVRTDRRRLCQCLINLLGNAVKFTEQGVIRMSVRLTLPGLKGVPAPGDLVEIAVADSGIGIREEDLPKLFGAFIRLLPPEHTHVKGTGLGLYLTRKIVREVLGGEIWVESIFGKGSCFTMRIPAKWQDRREHEESSGD